VLFFCKPFVTDSIFSDLGVDEGEVRVAKQEALAEVGEVCGQSGRCSIQGWKISCAWWWSTSPLS
jgi:hypothetical protein